MKVICTKSITKVKTISIFPLQGPAGTGGGLGGTKKTPALRDRRCNAVNDYSLHH